MTPLPLSVQVALAALVLIAAFTDVRSRTIPNWLTLAGVILGFALNSYATGWAGLKVAAIGFGVAALIFLPLFLMRWLGGGDIKLMAAIGALAGATDLLVVFLIDAILGGIAALVVIALKGRWKRTFRNIVNGFRSMLKGRAPYQDSAELEAGSDESVGMPRAVTIAVATLIVLWATRA